MRPHSPDPDARTFECRRCHRVCEPLGEGWRHARERCGVVMSRIGVPCARTRGHRWDHRDEFYLADIRRRCKDRYQARRAA